MIVVGDAWIDIFAVNHARPPLHFFGMARPNDGGHDCKLAMPALGYKYSPAARRTTRVAAKEITKAFVEDGGGAIVNLSVGWLEAIHIRYDLMAPAVYDLHSRPPKLIIEPGTAAHWLDVLRHCRAIHGHTDRSHNLCVNKLLHMKFQEPRLGTVTQMAAGMGAGVEIKAGHQQGLHLCRWKNSAKYQSLRPHDKKCWKRSAIFEDAEWGPVSEIALHDSSEILRKL